MMLKQSKSIFDEAVLDFKPYAVVAAVSGGNDSRCLLAVCQALDIHLDYVFHINTNTGIKQTTDYVRKLINDDLNLPYAEGDAGSTYEKRVLAQGFFGRGQRAHQFAYHLLKAGPMRSLVSKLIRQRKHTEKC